MGQLCWCYTEGLVDGIGIEALPLLDLDQELVELAHEYLKSSVMMLDICAALQNRLKQARKSLLLTLDKLEKLDENSLRVFLEDWKASRESSNPCTEEFFSHVLETVTTHPKGLLKRMVAKWKKLDKRLRSVSNWRKSLRALFAIAFVSTWICTIVGLAVAAPPIAVVVTSASATLIPFLGIWIDSLWKRYKKIPQGREVALGPMLIGTSSAIKNVNNMSISIIRLEMEIQKYLETMDFSTVGEIDKKQEVKQKLEILLKNIRELGLQAEKCERATREEKMVFLQCNIEHPKNVKSNRWKKFFSFM